MLNSAESPIEVAPVDFIELSLAHPELQDAKAIDRFMSYVSAYGVRVERTRALAPTAVYLRRPA